MSELNKIKNLIYSDLTFVEKNLKSSCLNIILAD